jgi:hypothetical protein
MWSNCMRFAGEAGVRAGDLVDLARTKTNLNGVERREYIARRRSACATGGKECDNAAKGIIHGNDASASN